MGGYEYPFFSGRFVKESILGGEVLLAGVVGG